MAAATVSSGVTARAGLAITSRARSGLRTASPSPPSSRLCASSTPPRKIADAACACPPPPSVAAIAPASRSAVRLRTTAKTRLSISTRSASAWQSVRSTILCARCEIPSTYRGQETAATRISTPASLCVSARRGRVRERAGVLVDPEREHGRLEWRDRDLAFGEDAHERRRQRAVGGDDRVLGLDPFGQLRDVVVEDGLLHVRVERHRLEL